MSRHLAVVFAVVLVASCDSSPSSPTLPATVTLAPGESARAESVRVTFVKVTSDSRCPINAICVSAGEAFAEFAITVRGIEAGADLALSDPARRSTEVRGIVVLFQELQPFPVAGQPTDPKDYRATISISAR